MGGNWDCKVAGHGVVTLPLLGVWGWFLSEQQERKHCRFAKGMLQQEKQGMGNKVQFYTALFARTWEYRGWGCGSFPRWSWHMFTVGHSQTNSFSCLEQNYRNSALGAFRSFFTVTLWSRDRKHPGSSSSWVGLKALKSAVVKRAKDLN